MRTAAHVSWATCITLCPAVAEWRPALADSCSVQVSSKGAAAAAAAAVVANVLESLLGALVQGKQPLLTNDVVNGLQICVAAALAIALVSL